MALTYLQISYPNFALGAIIDPEEANQNNFELVNKINDSVVAINKNEADIQTLNEVKATITYVDGKHSNLAGTGRTTETIRQNALNLISHKSSTDHDGRYYTKTQLDGGQLDNRYFTEAEINQKITTLNQKDTDIITSINNHKTSADHDLRYYTKDQLSAGELNKLYYTKTELTPWLSQGDTSIKEEIYTIVTLNNGDGTFNYTDGVNAYIGEITVDGYQVFELRKGYYDPGSNRIEVFINDTIRRSAKSGGIVEISGTKVALTQQEGAGAEITIKYYERLGIAAEYNIKLSENKPPQNDGKNMWFKIIG